MFSDGAHEARDGYGYRSITVGIDFLRKYQQYPVAKDRGHSRPHFLHLNVNAVYRELHTKVQSQVKNPSSDRLCTGASHLDI